MPSLISLINSSQYEDVLSCTTFHGWSLWYAASFLPRGRIIGGQDAADGQFPHQISMKYLGSHICGGSIVKSNVVLSAGHCVYGQSSSNLQVVAGTNKQSVTANSIQVQSIFVHEDYSSWTTVNDISLLHLSEDLVYSEKVQPIALGTATLGAGVECTLSGWGTTSNPGSVPENLQFIDLLTVSNDECAERHHPSGFPIISGQICTFTRSGQGACHGDSGGPLISGSEQIGIVSWGMPCAVGYPDVFTRVSAYINWINTNSK
ncbi:hypothetical protein FQR65_LT02145 [Abscondita terminalis]|nr:hypothetical protein FQR65_LT02145 [Abscondita terminalis]